MMKGKFLKGGILAVIIFSLAGCSARQKPAETGIAGEKRSGEVSAIIPAQTQFPAATPPQAAPEDASLSWDFGRVQAGQVVKHVFTFINTSPSLLAINAINTSCGCTVPEVKKKSLAPGESTEIEVSFNSLGYAGPVQQYVYVHTDQADNPVVKFTIKAEVFK